MARAHRSIHSVRVAIFAIFAILLGLTAAADAQTPAEIAASNAEVVRLIGAGDHARALVLAEQTLAQAQTALGPEHSETLNSTNNLGELYRTAGRYAEAEALYTRALATSERVLGREHPDTLTLLNNLAALYRAAGRYADAEPLYARALAARERVLGPEHPDTLVSANNLALLYEKTGRYGEAEPLYARTLAARERVLGPEHPSTLRSLNNLAMLYLATGRYGEAEPLLTRALASFERVLGPENSNTLTTANNLAALYQAAGRYGEAEPLLSRVLAVRERVLGADHPGTLTSLNNLALLYKAAGRSAEATPLVARALATLERTLGPEHPNTLTLLSNLAELYRESGRLAEAEPLLVRALAARERVLGPEHPDTLTSLNNLAGLYHGSGRQTEAEPLYARALDSFERLLGPDHPLTLGSLNNLGLLYQSAGRLAEAEPLLTRALATRERALGPEHPDTLISLSSVAELYSTTSRSAEAEALYIRALAASERVLGSEHPYTLNFLSNLAALHQASGRVAEAEALLHRAVDAWRGRYRRGAVLSSDRNATQTAKLSGHWQLALVSGLGTRAIREAQSAALIGAQFGRADAAGAALQAAAARFAAGDGRIATLIRARDSANARLAALEARRTAAFVENRGADVATVSGQIEIARRETEAAATAIAASFPAYADLVATDFVDLDELQGARGLLQPGEALIAFVEAEQSGAMQPAWLAMVVTRERAAAVRLRGVPVEVAARIAALRAQAAPVGNRPPAAFDLAVAHQLYRDLIAPLEPDLAGITRLLVVPDGPLQSLPLELLVVAPPPAGVSGDEAYRQATWLGDRYEIAVLPSVSALRALRRHAGRSAAANPLIAFADPAFGAAARQNLLASLSSTAGAISDVCALPSVPATARIGESLRRALGAEPGALLLGRDASEARLNQLNASGALRQARVIAFNTHGLTASEVSIAPEPALALSPDQACGRAAPASRNTAVDGLLTASEIVGLNLDADWVLLTACNTAAADGAAGAEPLSGLARAFFYAGARALLVSHWPALVSNDANVEGPTELLIAELFAPARSTLSKAAALSQARQAVRQRFPHPAYWAAFALVGDGR